MWLTGCSVCVFWQTGTQKTHIAVTQAFAVDAHGATHWCRPQYTHTLPERQDAMHRNSRVVGRGPANLNLRKAYARGGRRGKRGKACVRRLWPNLKKTSLIGQKKKKVWKFFECVKKEVCLYNKRSTLATIEALDLNRVLKNSLLITIEGLKPQLFKIFLFFVLFRYSIFHPMQQVMGDPGWSSWSLFLLFPDVLRWSRIKAPAHATQLTVK